MSKGNPNGNPNWKKGGPSPNPKGRPKRGESYTDIILNVGEEIDPATGKKNKVVLAQKLWRKAMEDDDLGAQKYLYDRVIGTPKQTVEANIYQDDPAVVGELRELRETIAKYAE